MQEILKTTIIGLFFGTFGTTIGGIIGVITKRHSKKFLSFVLAFASGLMMAIICFDLIPEALEISNLISSIFGILLGIVMMIFCDKLVEKKFRVKETDITKSNTLLKTGIIVSIGLAIHNFPEGLAIGSGFGASIKLGLSLAIAICLHDIPEGISMAIPMRNGGMKKGKVIFLVVMSGITTGIFSSYVRNYYGNRRFGRSHYWRNIRKGNCHLSKFCSRCHVIYYLSEN